MSFNRNEFLRKCIDIENYLDIIRANELATEYVDRLNSRKVTELDGPPIAYTQHGVSLGDWNAPCPQPEFALTNSTLAGGPSHVLLWVPVDATTDQLAAIEAEVIANVDRSYRSGLGWASGLSSYLMESAAQFAEVDTEVMANAILDLSMNVTSTLAIGAANQWSGIGKMLISWHGDGATSFFDFHSNYSSTLDRFAIMSDQIGSGFAAGCALINRTQVGTYKYVESVHDSLQQILNYWKISGFKKPTPEDFSEDLFMQVPNIMKIAGDVWTLLRLIPPIREATNGANVAVDAGKTVVSLLGTVLDGDSPLPDAHVEPKQFKEWSADAMYTVITDHMYNSIYTEYTAAMANLHHGEIQADVSAANEITFRGKAVEEMMLDLQGARNEWVLPTVPPVNLADPADRYGY